MVAIDSAVIEAARTHERDRYLSALLAPSAVRADLLVLAAYLGEVRRIPLAVHEAAVGEMRLQWWRDTLAGNNPSAGHPVADAMIGVVERRQLDRNLILAPLEGVSRELYEDGFEHDENLEAYVSEIE